LIVRFLIDAQLPPSLADQIVALGHEATHVANVGMLTSWIRVGNMRNRELFPIFVASFPAILAALSRGETVVEFSGF
jgi:predicted nuclease of predicted toxin-antitoxin system